MDTGQLTEQEIRDAVATALGISPGDIPEDENLVLLGLGSLEMMKLVNQWRRRQVTVEFRELVANPTLRNWSRLLVVEHEQTP